ncbi:recombinase family protein [Geomonas nitrogeniifigens]|uniref:Recombinase family protein n=1 Tax=Geomonas diazotrophica TaxID=2843197 RepID=A0ABX8JHK6_9BACT|nr:recombinase family protein [Geomonas nitrogeniifigens]QWV96992.1 recombinase family protein [Geomonas nitrogeniifigens]
MPKAYSYLRFSRPEQSQGDSFRRQYEAAKKYADEHGLDLDESLTFHDEGVSAYQGKQIETGRLGDFLHEVKQGRVEEGSFLLVESLDRISRQSARKAQRILEDICEEGITVVTMIDGRKYDKHALDSDPMALIMSLFTFFRAHDESETKATRLKAAWHAKRANIKKKPLTSKAPLWLRLNKDACRFELIEERAKLIRQMFDLYLRGTGPAGIAKQFNRERVPAWGRSGFWFESYITKILNNPAVYGVCIPHRLEHEDGKKNRVPLEPVAGYFPIVIEEETFVLSQDIKASRGLKGRKVSTPLCNIFSRLSRCPVCGSSMIFVNKGATFQYLACHAAKTGVGVCKYRSVPYYRLEASFIEAVRAGLKVPVDADKLLRIEESLLNHELAMNTAIQERRNIVDAVKAGTFSNDTVLYDSFPRTVLSDIVQEEGPIYFQEWGPRVLQDEIETLNTIIEANRKTIVNLKGQLNLIRPTAVEARIKELETVAKEQPLNRARFNAGLRTICDKVVVQYDHAVIDMHFKHTDLVLSVPVSM